MTHCPLERTPVNLSGKAPGANFKSRGKNRERDDANFKWIILLIAEDGVL